MDERLHIGAKLKALSAAMAQEANLRTAELGLTCSQSFFLGFLANHQGKPVYPRDLEREFDFSHPTVSGILSRLKSKGFVDFQPDENDRRLKQIVLTEKATACHCSVMRGLQEAEEKIVAGMTDAEIAEFHRLLGIAMQNLGASLGEQLPIEQEESE